MTINYKKCRVYLWESFRVREIIYFKVLKRKNVYNHYWFKNKDWKRYFSCKRKNILLCWNQCQGYLQTGCTNFGVGHSKRGERQ